MKKFVQSIDLQNVSKGTVVRGILMVMVLINYILSALDINPVVINETDLGNVVTIFLTVGTFVISYWKNNSWTKAAQAADTKLNEIKGE